MSGDFPERMQAVWVTCGRLVYALLCADVGIAVGSAIRGTGFDPSFEEAQFVVQAALVTSHLNAAILIALMISIFAYALRSELKPWVGIGILIGFATLASLALFAYH